MLCVSPTLGRYFAVYLVCDNPGVTSTYEGTVEWDGKAGNDPRDAKATTEGGELFTAGRTGSLLDHFLSLSLRTKFSSINPQQ